VINLKLTVMSQHGYVAHLSVVIKTGVLNIVLSTDKKSCKLSALFFQQQIHSNNNDNMNM
jgi:hypothetical protein